MTHEFGGETRSEADSSLEYQQITLEKGWALIDNFRNEQNLICLAPDNDDERIAYYNQLREETSRHR